MTEKLIRDEQEAIECLKKNKPTSGYYMLQESVEMAIQAIEKQVPKKPKKSGVTDSDGVFHAINGINGVPYDLCPNCETNLCTDGMFGGNKSGMKYCKNCGQKLDWSEE